MPFQPCKNDAVVQQGAGVLGFHFQGGADQVQGLAMPALLVFHDSQKVLRIGISGGRTQDLQI